MEINTDIYERSETLCDYIREITSLPSFQPDLFGDYERTQGNYLTQTSTYHFIDYDITHKNLCHISGITEAYVYYLQHTTPDDKYYFLHEPLIKINDNPVAISLNDVRKLSMIELICLCSTQAFKYLICSDATYFNNYKFNMCICAMYACDYEMIHILEQKGLKLNDNTLVHQCCEILHWIYVKSLLVPSVFNELKPYAVKIIELCAYLTSNFAINANASTTINDLAITCSLVDALDKEDIGSNVYFNTNTHICIMYSGLNAELFNTACYKTSLSTVIQYVELYGVAFDMNKAIKYILLRHNNVFEVNEVATVLKQFIAHPDEAMSYDLTPNLIISSVAQHPKDIRTRYYALVTEFVCVALKYNHTLEDTDVHTVLRYCVHNNPEIIKCAHSYKVFGPKAQAYILEQVLKAVAKYVMKNDYDTCLRNYKDVIKELNITSEQVQTMIRQIAETRVTELYTKIV